MKSGLLALSAIVALASGCKPRVDGSEAKDLTDTQQINYVPSENKFFVICREGRTHRGEKNAFVTKEELKTVCEDQGGGNPPPTGGGGQNPQGDLSACPTLPEKVKKLNVALAPSYNQEVANLAPALRQQRLCVGIVNGLKSLTEQQKMFEFLSGAGGNAQILIVIEKADTPVRYAEEDFALFIPSKITDDTVNAVYGLGIPGLAHEQCKQPYTTFNTADRNFKTLGGNVTCDSSANGFQAGWYRFSGAAGKHLAYSKGDNRCSTHGVFWINPADNPKAGDPPKDFTAKAFYSGNEANATAPAKVVNCGAFFLYYLTPSSSCSYRYCGED